MVVNYEFTIFNHKRAPNKFCDAIFGIFRVKLGGLDMKIEKTSEFIKVDLYLWAYEQPYSSHITHVT